MKLEDRVKEFSKELQPLLQKYNLKIGAIADFPMYKQLPIEVQLALEVVKKHGIKYSVAFQEGGQNGTANQK